MNLTSLWQSRIRSILHTVAEGETDHKEVANLAAHIGADYHDRFLIELLQNAEDQAVSAGLSDSTVVIVRTESVVAVANAGTPFIDSGVREITSAGISSKDPTVAIGNKGVGFKSVFQVTEEPELYSAPDLRTSFTHPEATRFKMCASPFSNSQLLGTVEQLLEALPEEEPRLFERLRGRLDAEPTLDKVIQELQSAAPWKFPLPLSEGDLAARLAHLTLPPGIASNCQTLVVLPVLAGEATTQVINRAIEELASKAGLVLLFLTGLSRVEIIDTCLDRHFEILREPEASVATHSSQHSSQLLRTTVTSLGPPTTVEETARYWLFSRALGRGSGSDGAEKESRDLMEVARHVPGAEGNWKRFDSATVSVAFPIPDAISSEGSAPPEAEGLFFIGLPTHDSTGMPACVNAPFHGTLSRTGLNLEEPLNLLLFEEIVGLFWFGIEHLKQASSVAERRCSTLMFASGPGPLATQIIDEGRAAEQEIVLGSSSDDFVRPTSLRLPVEEDLQMFETLRDGVGDIERFGFVLPDQLLLQGAFHLLVSLAGGEDTVIVDNGQYLARRDDGRSLLEEVAQKRRQGEADFWEPFLSWAVRRFELDDLIDQQVLPTGKDSLSSSDSRVFIRPRALQADEEADDDDLAGDVPEDITESLRFLDSASLRIWEPDKPATYTELARKLAPSDRPGLVRLPRKSGLINDAIAPRLQELANESGHAGEMCQLLRLAAGWLAAMRERSRARVNRGNLLVPVAGPTGQSWESTLGVYFGRGWLDGNTDSLLEEAYGSSGRSRLVPWRGFSALLGDAAPELDEWVGVMRALGVAARPRILRARRRRQAPLCANPENQLAVSVGIACPLKEAEAHWASYLKYAASGRPTPTRSWQPYDFEEVTWIDGLEREEARRAVIELVLTHASAYIGYAKTELRRSPSGGDAREVLSLWAFAVSSSDWQVIPTNAALQPARDTWLLSDHERSQEFAAKGLVTYALPRLREATGLLELCGASSIADAPPGRLIAELHRIGQRLKEPASSSRRAMRSLTHLLYGCLQRKCEAQDGQAIDALLDGPVPLLQAEELVYAKLQESNVIYLNDDPIRSTLIPEIDRALILPIAPREASRAIVDALRSLLGADRVVRASEARIETGFIRDATSEPVRLIDVLDREFSQRDVVSDLCVLCAYGREGRSLDPTEDTFRRNWQALSDTRVEYGTFSPGVSRRYAFDADDPEGPVLQVQGRDQSDVLEACWQILGPSYRDLLAAYVRSMDSPEVGRFFEERGIGLLERDKVEAAIDRKSWQLGERPKPVLFALWRRRCPVATVTEFEDEWRTNSSTEKAVSDWFEESDILKILASARDTGTDQDIGDVLELAGVSMAEYQDARHELGWEKLRFQRTEYRYEIVVCWIHAVLKSAAARDAGIALATAKEGIAQLFEDRCPDGLAWCLLDEPELISRLSTRVAHHLRPAAGCGLPKQWARLVEVWADRPPRDFASLATEGLPRRDIDEYRTSGEQPRASGAHEVVTDILTLASHLAELNGETLDTDAIWEHPRIAALTEGYWANRFAVLPVLRDVLILVMPKTAKKLTSTRVFRDPRSYPELANRFPELATSDTREHTPPPEQTYKILKEEGTQRELESDLAKGDAGSVGKSLAGFASQVGDLAGLIHATRDPLPPAQRRQRRGGQSQTRSRSPQNPITAAQTGLLGEAFVYELLRSRLPGFGAPNWVSGNRQRYGLTEEGDDSLGYDFRYVDIDGTLTQRLEEPECLIEVKSTEGEGGGAFPMSEPEWQRAVEAHQNSGREVYIIFCVASAREEPRIHDILFDPVKLWHDGQLRFAEKDLWVRASPRVPPC